MQAAGKEGHEGSRQTDGRLDELLRDVEAARVRVARRRRVGRFGNELEKSTVRETGGELGEDEEASHSVSEGAARSGPTRAQLTWNKMPTVITTKADPRVNLP